MNKADQPLPLGSLELSQVGESLAYLDVKNTIKSVKKTTHRMNEHICKSDR